MADEFKDMGEAVKHLELKMKEFKESTTTAAQEAALKEAKAIIETSEKKFADDWATVQKDLETKGATLEQIQGELKEIKAKGGRIKSTTYRMVDAPSWLIEKELKQLLSDKIGEKGNDLVHELKSINKETGKEGIEIKAVADISSANLTGDVYHTYLPWQLGMAPRGGTHFRDLVRTIQSATDYVQFPREAIPRGEGSMGRQATEGTAKSKLDYDWAMVDLTLTPIAGYCIVSRQSLRNIPFLQSYLPSTMMEDLLEAEDTDFANKLVAAATGSSTTTGATTSPDRLIFFMKNLIVGRYRANAFAVDPSIWALLLTHRPGTDNGYGLPGVTAVDPTGNVRIMGIPIYPVTWLTGGRVIVGDWSRVAIVESEGLQFRQSDSHASTFIANQITFLIERTEDVAIFRPEAFITTTLSLS